MYLLHSDMHLGLLQKLTLALHMTLYTFDTAWNTCFVKLTMYLNPTISLFAFIKALFYL